MNIKAFFVDALGKALELGIGTPDDVLRHATPDVLSQYLPRPLWARLIAACLGAPRTDAQLVVETVGVPNLCEHIPAPIIWACIAEMGARSLGPGYVAQPPIMTRERLGTNPGASTSTATPPSRGSSPSIPTATQTVLAPPPPPVEPAKASAAGTASPPPAQLPPVAPISEPDTDDERPATAAQRPRTPTSQRFRQSNTGIGGRTAGSGANQPRRPQAQAATPPPVSTPRRTGTEIEDSDVEWRLGNGKEIAVDDSQLVDWQSSETTQASGDDDFSDIGRKR